MDIGLFDHLDRRDMPLDEFYEMRLRLLQRYDAAGFYSYHLAEHHATPLGLAPVPGIFLAAATQRTERIRLGPCVYCLPLYDPLRLIEEVCMLDHLSRALRLRGRARHRPVRDGLLQPAPPRDGGDLQGSARGNPAGAAERGAGAPRSPLHLPQGAHDPPPLPEAASADLVRAEPPRGRGVGGGQQGARDRQRAS